MLTSIDSLSQDMPGATLEVVDRGEQLRLTNAGPGEIVVLGYQEEPYLRVTDNAVFENLASEAGLINGSSRGDYQAEPSSSYDADAPPEWTQISSEPIAEWHDHRVHWMAETPPPLVEDPYSDHVVIDGWAIGFTYDGDPVTATGDLVWEASPHPLPWLIASAVLAIAVVVLGIRFKTVLPFVLLSLGISGIAHHIGAEFIGSDSWYSTLWWMVSSSPVTWVAIVAAIASAIAIGIGRKRIEATFVGLVAAIVISVTGGIGDIAAMIPFGIYPYTVVLNIGLGLAAIVLCALELKKSTKLSGNVTALTGAK